MTITTTGQIILPVAFLSNTIPTGLPIAPFNCAFITLFSYKPRFHPLFSSRSSSALSQPLVPSSITPRPFVCEVCGMDFSRQHGSFYSLDPQTSHSLGLKFRPDVLSIHPHATHHEETPFPILRQALHSTCCHEAMSCRCREELRLVSS